ncbi:MAG: hypothetical protein ACE5KM_21215 [Planctomycetaceae bacterium]
MLYYTGKGRPGSGCRSLIAVMMAAALCTGHGFAADSPAPDSAKPLRSGPKVGSRVPSFYTRAVTGPLMNKSLCYVCRNGRRPVVMLFFRRVGPRLTPLLKGVDVIIDKHRADGLRGFGVFVGGNPAKAASGVQTFAFDNKIAMPLTIAGETTASAEGLTIHRDAAVTVVLYRKRKVVQTWAFRAGQLTAGDVKRLKTQIERFAAASP